MAPHNLISPCCSRCTHSPANPCRDLIRCIGEGPICHQDETCSTLRKERMSRAKRGGDGILIFVGAGTCGRANGANRILAEIRRFLAEKGLAAQLFEVGCVGFCQREVFVDIEFPGKPRLAYADISPSNIRELLETVFTKGELRNQFLYGRHGEASAEWKDVPEVSHTPFFQKQVKVVLRNAGILDPTSLDAALAAGAFQAVSKALSSMTPEEVCGEVLASGLRGRGGAGFPTGQKWNVARETPRAQKYLICNADEGDPGAFMDRTLMEYDPHGVLEGMALAGFAVGAGQGFVYVRGEYPLAARRLRLAIQQAEAAGMLGRNLFGTRFSFTIRVRIGAGAFVCGEETALMASIMGRRGQPVIRPPYPSQSGLWGHATLINNVETFGCISSIINRGSEQFKALGTADSGGTKVFSISGDIARVGVIEVPLGTSLRELLELAGGVTGGGFKAAQTGGASGGCIPASRMDLPIDYDSLRGIGTIMGSGGLVVLNDTRCTVDLARFFMQFCADESCGKCTPCRSGTRQALRILDDICAGRGREDDLRQLEELCRLMQDASLCGLGMAAPTPVLSTLHWYRDEYLTHIREGRCPAGVCEREAEA